MHNNKHSFNDFINEHLLAMALSYGDKNHKTTITIGTRYDLAFGRPRIILFVNHEDLTLRNDEYSYYFNDTSIRRISDSKKTDDIECVLLLQTIIKDINMFICFIQYEMPKVTIRLLNRVHDSDPYDFSKFRYMLNKPLIITSRDDLKNKNLVSNAIYHKQVMQYKFDLPIEKRKKLRKSIGIYTDDDHIELMENIEL